MFSVKKVQGFARGAVAFLLQSSSVLAVAFMLQAGSVLANTFTLKPSHAFPSDLLSLPPTDLSFESGRDTVMILEEVEVSALKLAGKLARTGKVLTLITADQIRASLGKSLGELLQEQVGISVVGARSAPGSNQEIYVRGANTGHVLLLMDGFPLNDPSHISQVMDWNLINLANIQKIEIIKGGQSTLYGSDAMSAVINLVTKNSDKDVTNGSLLIQGGGFGTHAAQVQVNTRLAK